MRIENTIKTPIDLPTDGNCPEMWGGEWAHDQDGEHPTGEELDAADIFFEKFGREPENNEDDQLSRLWAGNWSGYNSRSEGHLALCRQLAYWTGRDGPRVDRMFRMSAFYTANEDTREKWSRKSNTAGQTYGEMTVDLACRSCDIVFGRKDE